MHKIREFSDPHVVIALVGNKADLVIDDDRNNNYGKFAASTYSQQVLDTEEDNENSERINPYNNNIQTPTS